MENGNSYFLKLGEKDERNPNNFVPLEHNLSIFYRIGRLTERYRNCPTKLQLLNELIHIFDSYENVPNFIDVFLKHHYSNRLLKVIMEELGYRIPVSPNCSHFHAWRMP